MTDAVDRLPCSDVACALGGHEGCGEAKRRPSVDDVAGTFAGPDSVEWLREQRCDR